MEASKTKTGILVLSGITGLVGSEVRKQLLANSNVDTFATTLAENELPNDKTREHTFVFDVLKDSISKLESFIKKHDIKAVINCIAASNVDWCEDNFELAKKINGYFPGELAKLCADNNAHLVHISTDYVFDGFSGNYNENSKTNPVSKYGESKLLGDEELAKYSSGYSLCRTSTVFGPYDLAHSNYMLKTLNNLINGNEVPVFTDQDTSPTYTVNLASMLIELAFRRFKGLINTAGASQITRLDATNLLIDIMFSNKIQDDKRRLIKKVLMKDVPLKAVRPMHSTLDVSKAMSLLDNKPMTLRQSLEDLKTIYVDRNPNVVL